MYNTFILKTISRVILVLLLSISGGHLFAQEVLVPEENLPCTITQENPENKEVAPQKTHEIKAPKKLHKRSLLKAKRLSLYHHLLVMKRLATRSFRQAQRYYNDENLDCEEKEKLSQLIAKLTDIQTFLNKYTASFSSIVDTFNNGGFRQNPVILYKFIKICNYLRNVDEIEPRHIRGLKKEISRFNETLDSYYTRRKEVLSQADEEFYHELIVFNQQLTDVILKDEFLDLDIYDHIVDTFVYRPWEWICDHPILTTLIVGTSVGLLYYFVIRPRWTRFFVNRNHRYKNIQQFFAHRQGIGSNECGYESTLNAFILSSCQTEDEVREKVAAIEEIRRNNPQALAGWKNAIRQSRQNHPDPRRRNTHANVEVDEMRNHLLPQAGYNLLPQEIRNVIGARHNVLIIERPNVALTGQGIDDHLAQSVTDFKEQQAAQTAIIGLDYNPGRTAGHWIAAKINPDENLSAWVMNSTGGNVTGNSRFTNAIDLYTRNIVPAPAMLPINIRLDAAYNVITHNNDWVGALNHLRAAILQSTAGDARGSFFDQPQFRTIQDNMRVCFDGIRNHFLSPAINMHQVPIDGNLAVNLDNVQNINAFRQLVTQ